MKQRYEPTEQPLSRQLREQEERGRRARPCPHHWYMTGRGVRKCETCGAVEDDPWRDCR
jgi:hypothetical protein